MNSKIEIPLSRTKITGVFIGAIIFIVVGLLFISAPEMFISPIMRNPEVIRISGIAAVCIFGLYSVFLIKKLSTDKIGLTIDEFGITDNTNATSVGLIEWSDITGIVRRQVMSNKFLIVYTNNPDKYIGRVKNVVSKQAMSMNYKNYGSPISIISNSLKINFAELEKLIVAEFEERKKYHS